VGYIAKDPIKLPDILQALIRGCLVLGIVSDHFRIRRLPSTRQERCHWSEFFSACPRSWDKWRLNISQCASPPSCCS